MRFLYFDTQSKSPDESEKPKSRFWRGVVRFAAAGVTLATIWLVVGSIVYPLYWFEFIFKGGFHNLALAAYGFDYLLQHVSWVLFAVPILLLLVWISARFWVRDIGDFLGRFSFHIVILCLVACLVDAYALNRRQRWKYEVFYGLRNIAGATLQLSRVLVESALPPARIVPPADFLYVDAERVNRLHSELQPELVERERTLSTQNKTGNSIGLERKPLELKADGEHSSTEARKFAAIDPTVSQKALTVINDLLSRETPPYYSSFAQLSGFQLLSQARHLVTSSQKSLEAHSLFLSPTDTAEAQVLRQMAEARKKTPAADVEKGVRVQLSGLAGLILVNGDFKRVGVQGDSVTAAEQFKPPPKPIFFRFSLVHTKTAALIPSHAKLFVLGEVIKSWDGGPYVDLLPIAVLSGAETSP
jgi:hypothetical protein